MSLPEPPDKPGPNTHVSQDQSALTPPSVQSAKGARTSDSTQNELDQTEEPSPEPEPLDPDGLSTKPQGLQTSLAMLINIALLMLAPPVITLLMLTLTSLDSGVVGLIGLGVSVIAALMALLLIALPVYRSVLEVSWISKELADEKTPERRRSVVSTELYGISELLIKLGKDLSADKIRRKETQRILEQRASRDALTGLYNRHYVASYVQDHLEKLGADIPIGVLFLDLNNFKTINDLWGHGVGDEVLVEVGRRLQLVTAHDGTIARWGGDEFLLVLENIAEEELSEIAERVYSLFTSPVSTAAGHHRIATSIGTAISTPGESFDELLSRADSQMFDVKQANRGSKMIDSATVRLVEEALADFRVDVFFQPIVTITSQTTVRVCGAEALVRIRGNDGRIYRPDEFMPEILSSHYAADIDERVAKIALDHLAQWEQLGLLSSDFFVSLNLAPASIHDLQMPSTLEHIARSRGLSPRRVALEISSHSDEVTEQTISDLEQRGFLIGIDAVGTNRSNLDRLVDPKTDIAKLARRWLNDKLALAALVAICRDNNVKIIAQGVETAAQLEMLRSLDIEICQGYLISEPIQAADFENLLSPK